MLPITAPLRIGSKGIEVKNLHDSLLWLIERNLLEVSNHELIDRLPSEMCKQFYGNTTEAIVQSLKLQLDISLAAGISETDATEINTYISNNTDSEPIKIYGVVSNADGRPIQNATVRLYEIAFRSSTEVESTVTSDNGNYEIEYTPSIPEEPHKGLRLTATLADLSANTESEILFKVVSETRIDLTIEVDDTTDVVDEYTLLERKILDALTGISYGELTLDDANYLARETGENEELVKTYINAQIYSSYLGTLGGSTGAPALYGIIRTSQLPSIEAILNAERADLTRFTKNAVALNIISYLSDAQIGSIVTIVTEAAVTKVLNGGAVAQSRLFHLLSIVLDNTQTNEFLSYYYDAGNKGRAFWDELLDNVSGIGDEEKAQLQQLFVYAISAGNNPGMVTQMMDHPASHYAGMTIDDWVLEIENASIANPDLFVLPEGSDDFDTYAEYLKHNIDSSYQSLATTNSLITNPEIPGLFPQVSMHFSDFLDDNPHFDILRSSTYNIEEAGYNLANVGDVGAFQEELNTFQRLSAVTPNFNALTSLASNGITSAQDIVQMSQADFAASFSGAFGSVANATLAYSNAVNLVMASQVASLAIYESVSFDIPVINTQPASANPDWRSLFGSVDYCTCDHCLSVFSPSAYFVDTLELLKKYNVPAYNWLQKKRPDLWNLKLTCKNTNTSIPYIDIVNEILEDMAFSANAAAGSNPLYPIVAHDTTLDEKTLRAIPQYVKSVVSTTYPTTTGTTAYDKLKEAKYPWTAPYNYFLDQVRELLNLINIKPYQVAQAFASNPEPKSIPTIDLACSYLEISKDSIAPIEDERSIIIDTNTSNLPSYYVSPGALNIIDPADRTGASISVPAYTSFHITTFLGRVDIFLQQTKLSFQDLLELLDCFYINPITGINTTPSYTVTRPLKIDSTDPSAACDTSKMTIAGLTLDDLVRIHQFVRLWRKTGWSKYELDRVFFSLGITTVSSTGITSTSFIDDDAIIALAQFKRATELLNCAPDDIAPLFSDIPFLQYSNYGGDKPQSIPTQYEQLFRNQAVVPNFNIITGYPFKEQLVDWKNTAPVAAPPKQHIDYTLAALQITGEDFDYIVQFFENNSTLLSVFVTNGGVFEFSYQNVLTLLRETRLARLMGLTIREWCQYRAWMAQSPAINPFALNGTGQLEYLFAFLDKVRISSLSGMDNPTLLYLFEDKFEPLTKKEQTKEGLFNSYKTLRSKLAKINTPVANTVAAIDEKSLLEKFLLIFDYDDATFIINRIKSDSDPAYNSSIEDKFKSLLPSELTVQEKDDWIDILVDSAATNYESDLDTRRRLINEIYNKSVLKAQVRDYFSTTYQADSAALELLLEGVSYSTIANYDILLNEDFIHSTGEPDTNDQFTQDVLMIIELLSKVAVILNNWKVNAAELKNLLKYTTALAIPNLLTLPVGNCWSISPASSPITFSSIYSLLSWMYVRDEMYPTPTSLLDILATSIEATPGSVLKTTWFDGMRSALQMNESDMEELIGADATVTPSGILQIDFSSGTPHLNPDNYMRVLDAASLRDELQVNMATCDQIAKAVLYAEDQATADLVVQAVKSRYSNEEWLTQVKPVNDRLRIKRRDALTEYLLANAPDQYKPAWITANDIYETLLIDTEMMPIVQTSRVKQAISSVQLFVNRCLLQKEFDGSSTLLTLKADTISQWNLWRKWYRIWEANRKIFVYPENWIEPDLRDDKSPIFKELEKYLKQNEITQETMEDAYRTYLERLDDIAHLEVVGYYLENVYASETIISDTIIHVFGRSRSNPPLYYYRKRVDGIWSAWEKMETQIDGDKFAPVIWRGRLRLYWLVLSELSPEKRTSINPGEETAHPEKYLKIELCWTELKNGKWTAKQIGKEWIETEPYGAWRIIDLRYNYGYATSWAPNMKPYTLKTFAESFKLLKESIMPYSRVNANGELEVILIGRKKYIAQDQLNNYFDLKIPYAAELRGKINSHIYSENSKNQFRAELASLYNDNHMIDFTEEYYGYVPQYETFKARFTIKHNKVHADRANLPYTFYDSLVENHPYKPTDSQYSYQRNKPQGYDHIINNNILNYADKLLYQSPEFQDAPNPEKFLTFYRHIPDGNNGTYIPFPKFFYKDYRNSFFVEEVYTDVEFTATIEGGDDPVINITHLPGVFSGVNSLSGFVTGNVNILNTNEATIILNQHFPTLTNTIKDKKYRFYPFYHYRTNELLDQLNVKGLKGLFDWDFIKEISESNDEINFLSTYDPTAKVVRYLPSTPTPANDVYPNSHLDFSYDHPYSIYNWELFFHIPMLIANKLMQDQKFFEAMEWYHFVFNPTNTTSVSHGSGKERFWQFYPFYKECSKGILNINQIMQSPDLQSAVARWANNPFKPHVVAKTRFGAYMKNVLMKYLDNLIEWGDQLFRRDTMESINEATLLYVLAAQLLGRRPVKIPARVASAPQSYQDLITPPATMNAFGNALVAIQTMMAPTMTSQTYVSPNATIPTMFYFCIPPNEKLLGYWDIVADRLFKIRNSQSIDGVERQLALFEPPIDPALLVKAAASGISLSDAINEMFAPLPAYRFNVMSQKATELTQEVKSLGGALLAALEKKDAEKISLLRSSHELVVLEAAKEVRILQLQESQAQIAVLQDQKALVTLRLSHYQNLLSKGLNSFEQSQLDSMMASIPLKIQESVLRTLSGIFYAIPEFKIGAPTSIGLTFGGSNVGNITSAGAGAVAIAAIVNEVRGTMAGIKANYARRTEDWTLQSKSAEREIRQIDKQIVAAEIRKALAERELSNHELQMKNSQEMDQAMHDKYTNEELYDWMIGEISLTYFQAYKLAFDVAKRAERCYLFEINTEPATPFIQFGYWDSLKKGLLAGDMLAHDIKRMEVSYLEQNRRQHELTKHISLATYFPEGLQQLRLGKSIQFQLPEWIFDMDYPGHYLRRIKSVSLSIPCVAGPYTTVSAKLSLNSSKYRKKTTGGSGYAEDPGNDSRFMYLPGGGQSIATSSAQNDSGMFELNFRDERYLPFEGMGVIGDWSLDLPAKYASYDKATISDVIMHINYTAKYDGGGFKDDVIDYVDDIVGAALPENLKRVFSLKHEFAEDYHQAFLSTVVDGVENLRKINFALNHRHFPIFCNGKTINIKEVKVAVIPSAGNTNSYNSRRTIGGSDAGLNTSNDFLNSISLVTETINAGADLNMDVFLYRSGETLAATELEDWYLILDYEIA